MGLFSRKQGRVATVRAMARFTESEREQGMDMLQAAEDVFVDLGAPSRLGSVIFSACAGAMGVDEDDPVFGVLAGASLLGYACRMASPAVRVPDDIADAIELQLEIGDDGELDYDAMADAPEALRNLRRVHRHVRGRSERDRRAGWRDGGRVAGVRHGRDFPAAQEPRRQRPAQTGSALERDGGEPTAARLRDPAHR